MTAIGQYRHRVRLEEPGDPEPDDAGGYRTVPRPLTPPVWDCRIEAATPHDLERVAGGVISATATHILRGRYHAGITNATRIRFRERLFDVESVHDREERRRELEVVCHEVVGQPVAVPRRADADHD